jgi:hypothetical protein
MNVNPRRLNQLADPPHAEGGRLSHVLLGTSEARLIAGLASSRRMGRPTIYRDLTDASDGSRDDSPYAGELAQRKGTNITCRGDAPQQTQPTTAAAPRSLRRPPRRTHASSFGRSCSRAMPLHCLGFPRPSDVCQHSYRSTGTRLADMHHRRNTLTLRSLIKRPTAQTLVRDQCTAYNTE